MQNSWIVLLPPLLVVLLAATTRRVFLSLLTGIFSALLIVHNFDLAKVIPTFFARVWKTTELGALGSWQAFWGSSNLFICLFLLLLGVLITILRVSGGAYAYGNFVTRHLRTARSAEFSSLFLSLFFFIDDYFSCLTVGSVMQSVSDRFNIPRVKLGLLVNSMAAPLVVLLPVSSWVAEIMVQLKQSGVNNVIQDTTYIVGDPFIVYTQMIPFLFYSVIMIFAVWYLVWRRLSYGVVYKHEQVAQKTGNLFAGKVAVIKKIRPVSPDVIAKSQLIDFIFPIGFLFFAVFVAMLYFGSYWLMGGASSMVTALQTTQPSAALFVGVLVTLLVSSMFLIARKKIIPQDIPYLFKEGISLMGSSVCILILIWTLSSLIKADLKTGEYLASLLIGQVNISFFPAMFFLVAVLMASTMGSAWGTIGILIPIGVPMLVSIVHGQGAVIASQVPMLFPLLGAIVSGAIVGNHMSPISDTMLMSSTSAGAYHIDLVRAQLSLTIPAVIAAAAAFLVAGFTMTPFGVGTSVGLSLLSGIVCVLITLHVLHALSKNKKVT